MKQALKVICMFGLLVLFSGCGRVIDWGKQTFDQAQVHDIQEMHARRFIRSTTLYDQFTTVAMFNALWLSDDVRTLYVEKNSAMHGKSKEMERVALRRQLQANEKTVSFYILSLDGVPLNEKPAPWNMYLQVDGKKHMPIDVKRVDLNPEYKSFFGSLLTKHKEVYEARFERLDSQGKDILTSKPTDLMLVLRDPLFKAQLVWSLDEQGKLIQKKKTTAKVSVPVKRGRPNYKNVGKATRP